MGGIFLLTAFLFTIGIVYPAVMALYWAIFKRRKVKFLDFMKDI